MTRKSLMFYLDIVTKLFGRVSTARMRRRRDGSTSVVSDAPVTVSSDGPDVNNREDRAVEASNPSNEHADGRIAGDAENQHRGPETRTATNAKDAERDSNAPATPHPHLNHPNTAVVNLEEILAASTSASGVAPDPAVSLGNLATQIYARYGRLGEPRDLRAAIDITEAAMKLMLVSDPRLPTIQSNLSAYIGSRYDRYGNVTDLDLAIEQAEAAVFVTPARDHDRAGRLGNLGNRCDPRYQRSGDMDDIERAIKYAEAAVTASISQGGDHAYTPAALSLLGTCLYTRYRRTEDPTDLEAAVQNLDKGISLLQGGKDDHQYIPFLNNLSHYLEERFKRFGELDDLETAIQYSETVLDTTPEGHQSLPSRLNGLSNHYNLRYLALGNIPDLENSLKHAKASVAATPADHPHLAGRLTVLSDLHRVRFDRIGDLADLNSTISFGKAAEAATPADHPQMRQILKCLAQGLYVRYQRFGEMNDLETAIHHAEVALTSTPVSHPDRVQCLNILSLCLNARYQRMSALKDLEAAIKHSEAIVKATPESSPALADRLNNLSTALDARYQRLGQHADLQLAIQTAKAALAATTENSPVRATILSNLSATFFLGFSRASTPDGGDLEDAIKYVQEAVNITPYDDPDLAGRLSNLSNALEARFLQHGQVVDLEAAIDQGENVLIHTPLDHPSLARRSSNLAYTFLHRYNLSNSPSDGQRAYAMYRGAWKCLESPPLVRIMAAWSAVRYFPSLSSLETTSSIIEDAVRLMPKISLVALLERDDQQHILGELFGLSADAAAAALEAGKGAAYALGLLELGRGILSGFVMDMRSGDIAELKRTNRELCEQFLNLRVEINLPLKSPESDFAVARRKQAMEEFELTLARVRAIPDYKEFLLPATPESLCETAKFRPIVVVNCTSLRSDAIIVTMSSITALQLPELLYTDTKAHMKQLPRLLKGGPKTAGSRNKTLNEMLRWLWDVAVKPIHETLGLDEAIDVTSQKSTTPRIWWIGVGELSKAPFHAAGDHKPGSMSNTLSRVCSSYISTIKALSYARQRRFTLPNANEKPGLLLVTMSATLNHTPLPNVEQEAALIVSAMSKTTQTTQTTILYQPSAAEILQQFPRYDAIHFACHGVSDKKNPSKSSLILLDNSSGIPTADPLTVQEISNTHIERAQLAYLSACSTADNTGTDLSDETIHLASAFQLAGFKHVLANLWKSKDEACTQAAGDFYNTLLNSEWEDDVDEGLRVSIALRRAVTRLRDQTLRMPIVWAPFMHTGG